MSDYKFSTNVKVGWDPDNYERGVNFQANSLEELVSDLEAFARQGFAERYVQAFTTAVASGRASAVVGAVPVPQPQQAPVAPQPDPWNNGVPQQATTPPPAPANVTQFPAPPAPPTPPGLEYEDHGSFYRITKQPHVKNFNSLKSLQEQYAKRRTVNNVWVTEVTKQNWPAFVAGLNGIVS